MKRISGYFKISRRLQSKFFAFALLFFSAIFLIIPDISYSQTVTGSNIEVEIELAPEFIPEDATTIKNCYSAIFSEKFPIDFIKGDLSVPTQMDCPSLTLWGYTHEYCFMLQSFTAISPVLKISLFFWAVVML